jgi:hypothetical protein
MADDPKLPPKPHDTEPLQRPTPRATPPVVEREPLTITVVEPAPAAEALRQQVRVEAPPSIDLRRSSLAWLLILGAVLLFVLYRLQFSPLIQRAEHGLQRRIFGERSYEAHHDPHSRFDQAPRAHEDAAHR